MMEPIIIKKKKDVYKIVTAVLIALFPIHPYFTLHSDWPIVLKCILILICLAFNKSYVFKEDKQYLQINFFNIKIYRSFIFEKPADYLLVHKALEDIKYEIRLGSGKDFEILLIDKDYFYISNMASQLSHLLHIDLYNPFEDYD